MSTDLAKLMTNKILIIAQKMTKVVHIKRFPFMGGFYAINLFGIIFTVQELNAVELNHERIHTAQQRELLYIGFYL